MWGSSSHSIFQRVIIWLTSFQWVGYWEPRPHIKKIRGLTKIKKCDIEWLLPLFFFEKILDKNIFMWYNGALSSGTARSSIISYLAAFVKRKITQKLKKFLSQNCATCIRAKTFLWIFHKNKKIFCVILLLKNF